MRKILIVMAGIILKACGAALTLAGFLSVLLLVGVPLILMGVACWVSGEAIVSRALGRSLYS